VAMASDTKMKAKERLLSHSFGTQPNDQRCQILACLAWAYFSQKPNTPYEPKLAAHKLAIPTLDVD